MESYPQAIYGQQQTLLSLLEACPRHNVVPLVAVPEPGSFVDLLRARGIPVEAFQQPPLLSRYGGSIYRYSRRGKLEAGMQALRYVHRIRSALRQLRPDAVFCNDMRGLLTFGLAARALRLRVMIWDKLDRRHGWLDFLQLPLANVNAIISNAVACKYPRWQRRWFGDRIVLIPDGIEAADFSRARSIRPALGLAEADMVFGIVGSLTWRKGQDRVLGIFAELARKVPGARLVVVGEPATSEDEAYLDRLPMRDDPRVLWLGIRDDVPEIMRSIDVLVVPSREEGMGRVVLEAMAAGRPVVGARTGGVPEVVLDGKTGLLFDGEDPRQLLACLVRLGNSAALRARLGEAGRRRVRACFDRRTQMDRVLKLLKERCVDGDLHETRGRARLLR